jgi:hypothetical protein
MLLIHGMRLATSRLAPRVLRHVLTGLLLLIASSAVCQDATEPSLKAALIYNFARFTTWPADALPANAPFSACVVGDLNVSQSLERSVRDRLLAGHRIVVPRVGLQDSLKSCHLLYVSGIAPIHVTRILAELQGSPVLTITDQDGGRVAGGIAHIFVENGGRMRFDLDHGLAKQSHLQLSSKLLTLASHVLDASVAGER